MTDKPTAHKNPETNSTISTLPASTHNIQTGSEKELGTLMDWPMRYSKEGEGRGLITKLTWIYILIHLFPVSFLNPTPQLHRIMSLFTPYLPNAMPLAFLYCPLVFVLADTCILKRVPAESCMPSCFPCSVMLALQIFTSPLHNYRIYLFFDTVVGVGGTYLNG